MSVVPTQVAVSTSVPTLTLAAGTAGGVAIANSIDASQDYLLIYTNSATATQGINRNTLLGLASAPVGLTDSQTLTNKTLTSPTINSATLSGTLSGTYTIGGTPTFPSSVVTLTGSQTLTNKILTSPTINTPTITNATITADTLSGFTTSNSGTVYGMSVAGGLLSSSALAGKVNFAALVSSIFSGQVTSFSNGGSAGGTFYYINLGGIKLLWGNTAQVNINATSVSVDITMPASFFSTIQSGSATASGNYVGDTRQLAIINPADITTTTITCFNVTSSTTTKASFFVFIIGT